MARKLKATIPAAGDAARWPRFPAEMLDLPDEDLGHLVGAWWIGYSASEKGLQPGEVTDGVAEQIRAATAGMDTNAVKLVGLEKVLKRWAGGDVAGAGNMFRDHVRRGALEMAAFDEATTGRRKQRARAKEPRVDGLQAAILRVLSKHPDAALNEVLRLLPKEPEVERIGDGSIEWHDDKGRAGETEIAALRSRVSRARKALGIGRARRS